MANELSAYYPTPSLSTIYFVVAQTGGKMWNGTAFESINTAHWNANYAIAASDSAASSFYLATMPSAIANGYVSIYAYRKLGGSYAATDTLVGVAEYFWNGASLTSFPAVAPASWIPKAAFADDTKFDGTCPSASTATTMNFDAADGRVNNMSGNVNQMVEIVGGTGIGQVIPIAAISGSSGSKVGTVLVGTAISPTLDATSQYLWSGIAISSLPPSAKVVSVSGSMIVVTGYPSGKDWNGQRLYHVPSGEIRVINAHSYSSPNYTLTLTAAFSSVTAGDSVCLLS